MHAIWASSFKPTGESFPLVWDLKNNDVPAINVTKRYLDIYQEVYQSQLAGGNYVPLKVMMFKDQRNMRKSDDRGAANVDIVCGKDQIGGGRTAGPTQDMNCLLYTSCCNYFFR